MKLTLLDMVQTILSSMDSDEVNSISDTAESLQVAKIVRDSYIELTDRLELEEQYTLFELEATDANTPTIMTVPNDIETVLWVKYDYNEDGDYALMTDIKPKTIKDFFDHIYMYDTEASYFLQFTHEPFSGHPIDVFCYTDRAPEWYTVTEDHYVIFNSYNVAVDTNLQKSKSMAYGKVIPTFSFTDSFTPRLDSNQFGLLLNEAKRQAFIELKQSANPVAEQRARRGWVRSQRNSENVPTQRARDRYPNYGRK